MPDDSRKVLVTGGAGFVGSHVADAHLSRGDQVWIVDDLSSGRIENVPADAVFLQADIGSEEAARLIRRERFDVINHQAAQIDVRISVADPVRDARVNVLGLINVLEAACRAGTRRVVFASSGGVVYGEPEEFPTPETAPKGAMSPYGVTKLAGERYLDYYRQVHGLEYAALRYGNVYGPRQDPHGEAGVVAIFSTALLAGEPLVVYGNGEQTRDYIFVGDVARANLIVAEKPLSDAASIDFRAFNVGTEVATSVNTLADALQGIAGVPDRRRPHDARPGEIMRSTLATAKLRALGWSPTIGLEEGLRRTFDHIKAAQAPAPATANAPPSRAPHSAAPTTTSQPATTSGAP